MGSISLYRLLITLLMTVMLLDAASLTKSRKVAENVSDVAAGTISPAPVLAKQSAKSRVMRFFRKKQPRPEPAPSWDPVFCGEDLTLGDHNRRVTLFDSTGGYNAAQSAQPCSTYSVQIVNGHDIFIGFAPRHCFLKNWFNFNRCGYYVHVGSGLAWSHEKNGWGGGKAYGTPHSIPQGSVVTAIHDTSKHTIKFEVNGKSLGVALTNVQEADLFATVDFHDKSEDDSEILIIHDR
jgi:hypothetical protein